MKKIFIWGTVALVMLALTGCPGDEATTKGSWNKGLTDFEVQTGDNPGEIKYKFSATDPAAETYTLYYALGSIPSAALIITIASTANPSQVITATPGNIFQTLPDLKPAGGYSLVVEAKKGTSDTATSDVKRVTAKESEMQPGDPTTPTGWTKGLTDFEVQTGDNAGEIKYKFSVTDPAAETYTLYYTPTTINSATAIIFIGQKIDVPAPPGDNFIVLNKLIANTTYSLVVEAKKGNLDPAMSHVKQIKAKENLPQLELTVTAIPSGTTILAATLFDDTLLTTPQGQRPNPLAVGLNLSGTCKFAAYDPNSPTQMGGTWTQTGQYYIVLATNMNGNPPNYIYTAGGEQPVKYNFTQSTASISFNQFKQRE